MAGGAEVGGSQETVPGAGWFPDPWRLAPLRWWDGRSWTGAVASPPKPPLPRNVRWYSGLLATGMVVFGGWAGVWLLVLPLLLLTDSLGGTPHGHDLRNWAVIFAVAATDALVCLAMFIVVRSRPQLGARALIAPAVGTLGMVLVITVLPGFRPSVSSPTFTSLGAASVTRLSGSPNPALAGSPVTLRVYVSALDGRVTPTGTVTLYLRVSTTTRILAVVRVYGGEATYTTTSLPVGADRISATYLGDGALASSFGQTTESVYTGLGAL